MNKTALMIAYYFPPLGMGGVQRMAKLAKYLPQFGYDVIVLTVKPIRYPANDVSLLDELPAEVSIFRSGSSDPARIARILPLPLKAGSRLKAVAKEKSGRFWPDSKVGWKRPALRMARKIIADKNVEVIISSSPPITAHLVAMDLKKNSGIPWVADFRDPWESLSPDELYKNQSLVQKSHLLLRDIIESADTITAINDSISRNLGPSAVTIMGGYDPDDFGSLKPAEKTGDFLLCYMGTVGSLHPIVAFLEAAEIAARVDVEFSQHVRIRVIGANNREELKAQAAAYGLDDRLEVVDYLPHREALKEAGSAAVSLISIPDGYPGILTGKIFDYLALPAPILASVPQGGEIERIVKSCRGGICVKPKKTQELAEAMLQLFRHHQSGATWKRGDIAPYTRQEVARSFAGVFDRITDG